MVDGLKGLFTYKLITLPNIFIVFFAWGSGLLTTCSTGAGRGTTTFLPNKRMLTLTVVWWTTRTTTGEGTTTAGRWRRMYFYSLFINNYSNAKTNYLPLGPAVSLSSSLRSTSCCAWSRKGWARKAAGWKLDQMFCRSNTQGTYLHSCKTLSVLDSNVTCVRVLNGVFIPAAQSKTAVKPGQLPGVWQTRFDESGVCDLLPDSPVWPDRTQLFC